MRLGLAQIDTRVGDLRGNAERILGAAEAAARAGAALVVFPELVVTGYPPRDLLYDAAFVRAAIETTEEIARRAALLPPLLVGTVAAAPAPPTPRHPGLLDAAALLRDGRVAAVVGKRLLPAYDVFHEPRWFVPAGPSAPIEVGGRKLGVLVCEDAWDEGYPVHPALELRALGAEALVCLSASPYRSQVLEARLFHARRPRLPLAYVNAVGAEDELVFDGASFVVSGAGNVVGRLPRFEEAVAVVDLFAAEPLTEGSEDEVAEPEAAELFRALTLGVRGFAQKNRLGRAFLGLSGGVDSALVACIAREALGGEAVTALALPSRFSDPRSTACARTLAASLGIGFEVLDLEPLHAAAETTLASLLEGDTGTTAENVQARLRMVVLMAHVNRRGGLLLNTSNKTELALGYGTIYGDMAGTLGVIGDLTKPQVYALARWYDGVNGVIPRFILERPPSAELRAGQIDPFDYPRVAPIVEALVLGEPPPAHATAEDVARLARLVRSSEHKRWQSGIVLKVTARAFGTGRMVPVTRGG